MQPLCLLIRLGSSLPLMVSAPGTTEQLSNPRKRWPSETLLSGVGTEAPPCLRGELGKVVLLRGVWRSCGQVKVLGWGTNLWRGNVEIQGSAGLAWTGNLWEFFAGITGLTENHRLYSRNSLNTRGPGCSHWTPAALRWLPLPMASSPVVSQA